MRFVQNSNTRVGLFFVSALAAIPTAQAQTNTQSLPTQSILVRSSIANAVGGPSFNSTSSSSVSVQMFNSANGVLTGASVALTVDPGSNLNVLNSDAGGKDSSAQLNLFGSLTQAWSTSNCNVQSGCLSFSQIASTLNTQSNGTASSPVQLLAPLLISSTQASTIGAYVANTSGAVQTIRIDTVLLGSIAGQQKSIVASVNPGTSYSPTPPDLRGSLTMTYSYLNHSNASFALGASGSADLNAMTLNLGPAGATADFTVVALGSSANTTDLSFGKTPVTCTGACDQFSLSTASFATLLAGGSESGTVTYLGAGLGKAGSATYTFTFDDVASKGATASQRSNSLTLTVTAVPEPHNAAMFLAGLGAIGWMSRRRRSAKDQVAKL
jgi:hypothetical protein